MARGSAFFHCRALIARAVFPAAAEPQLCTWWPARSGPPALEASGPPPASLQAALSGQGPAGLTPRPLPGSPQ